VTRFVVVGGGGGGDGSRFVDEVEEIGREVERGERRGRRRGVCAP